MIEYLKELNPFIDPMKRKIIGNFFWAFITGFAAYLCVIDVANGNKAFPKALNIAIACLTGFAFIVHIICIYIKTNEEENTGNN